MELQNIEAWVLNPENALHPEFKNIRDEVLLILALEEQKHNHVSMESFKERLVQPNRIGAAKFVGEIAMKLHKREHGKEATRLSQVRHYNVRELYDQWVQDHIDTPPDGFNNKCQCEHDQELQERIDESLTLCQLWINSKKLKTNCES